MANSDELPEVEVIGQGHDLHWEKLDVDLSVSGLLAGLFGTKPSWAANTPRDPEPRPRRQGGCRAPEWPQGWPSGESGGMIACR
jgi:hypothetical protein